MGWCLSAGGDAALTWLWHWQCDILRLWLRDNELTPAPALVTSDVSGPGWEGDGHWSRWGNVASFDREKMGKQRKKVFVFRTNLIAMKLKQCIKSFPSCHHCKDPKQGQTSHQLSVQLPNITALVQTGWAGRESWASGGDFLRMVPVMGDPVSSCPEQKRLPRPQSLV